MFSVTVTHVTKDEDRRHFLPRTRGQTEGRIFLLYTSVYISYLMYVCLSKIARRRGNWNWIFEPRREEKAHRQPREEVQQHGHCRSKILEKRSISAFL